MWCLSIRNISKNKNAEAKPLLRKTRNLKRRRNRRRRRGRRQNDRREQGLVFGVDLGSSPDSSSTAEEQERFDNERRLVIERLDKRGEEEGKGGYLQRGEAPQMTMQISFRDREKVREGRRNESRLVHHKIELVDKRNKTEGAEEQLFRWDGIGN
jgi:hypothetical protein